MSDAAKPAYLSTPALRERGWSPRMIERLLGAPDRLADNPIYKTAAPVRLFLQSRVEEAERSEAFATLRKAAERRSATAKAAAEKRTGGAPRRRRMTWEDAAEIGLLARNNRVEVAPDRVQDLPVRREVLKGYIGRRAKWRAAVGRSGSGGAILLLSVTEIETGSSFDHQWHYCDETLGNMLPREGDTIEFEAEAFWYSKRYHLELALDAFTGARLLDADGVSIDVHAAPRAFRTRSGWWLAYRGVRAPAATQEEAEAKAREVSAWLAGRGLLPGTQEA